MPRSLRPVLVALLVLAACGDAGVADVTAPADAITPADATTTTASRSPIRLLALGDSYTIGEGVDESERWPVLLAGALEDEGWPSVDVEIVARTGWTVAELDAGIDRSEPEGPFDLVTVLIGVNDQFRGYDPDGYRAEVGALLDRAAGLSVGPVLMVSIPDWGVTPLGARYDPAAIAADIDLFNSIGRGEAEARSIRFVDITPISRSGDPTLVAADGLHPSGAQYAAWVDAILPVALGLLGG